MAESRSRRYSTVRKWYELGLWPESAVCKAVESGWITQAECDEILDEPSESIMEQVAEML